MSKQIFTIAVLDDKDYLKLDKEFSNITRDDLENSFGFADRETGEAFVRKSGIGKDIDMLQIQHEIQELMSDTSEHEKDGIRYGWFKKIFGFSSQPVVNVAAPLLAAAIPGVGPIVSGLLAGATSAATQKLNTGQINPVGVLGSALGGGLLKSAMLPGIEASKAVTTAAGQSPSILGQIGSGLQSAVGIQSGAQKALSNIATTATPGMMTSGAITPGTPASNLSKVGLQEAGRMNIPVNILGSTGSVIPSVSGNISKVATQEAPKAIGEKVGEAITSPTNILGAGSLLASQTIKQPEFQMPSSIEDIRSKLIEQTQEGKTGGLTEVGKQAQLELGNILKSTPQELYPTATDAYYDAALRRTRENYAKAQEAMDKAYNLAGVYGTGEHLAQKAKLQEELARTESALQAETEQRRFELARTAKYQAIQDSLGVDKDVMDDLVGLSGLDVQTAAMIYGAKAQDVQTLRESLGTLGVELILRGMNKGQVSPASGVTINLANR